MPEHTLAHRIRAKHPGVYDDLSDADLEAKVTAKFPGVYDDLPRSGEQPSLISRATEGVGSLFQSATESVPFLERIKEQIPRLGSPASGVGQAVASLFPTTPLDVGLTVLPGAAGQAAKGIRAVRGASKAATAAPRVAGLLPAPSSPAARAGETIRLGQASDLGQQFGRAVSSTEPLRPLGRHALPGPVTAGPIGPRVSPPVSRMGRASEEIRKLPDIDIKPVSQPLGQPRLVKDTGKFVRQLPEAEQAAVMANRQRWVADLAQAGIEPTPKLLNRMDQLGVKYRQHQQTLQQLKSLATGQVDESALAMAQQQARSLGAQLGGMRSLVKGGRVKSEEALLKAVEKALDEAGSAAGQLVTRIATAGAGAAAGGAVGDTPEERLRNAAIGGVGGALAPSAIRGVGRAAKVLKPESLEDFVYFSLLSNPVTAAKANLGSIGAVFVKGTELINEGLNTLNPKMIVQGGKALKELLPGSESMRIYFRALKNPRVAQEIVGETGRVPGTGLTGQTVGRVFSAGDAAAVNALKKAGIGVDEARTLTLAGDPTSKIGQATMKGLETVKREGGALGRAAVPLVSPFPRVGIQALERGLERVPGLNVIPGAVAARTPGDPLLRQAGQIARGAGRGLVDPGNISRATTGAAAGGAGFALQDEIPPWAVPLVGAAAGPAVLPFAIGHALSLAQQGGGGGPRAITGAVSENLPIGGEAVRSFIDPASILRRLVPGALGAVARGTDPAFGRETGGRKLKEAGIPEPFASVVGPAAANIPGVRQQLPEKFDPVSAFGRPRSEPQGAIGRVLVPTQQRFVPGAMGGDDPLLGQLREMGIELPTPRMLTREAEEIGRQGRLSRLSSEGDIQRAAVEAVLSVPEARSMSPEDVRAAILEVKAEIKKVLKQQEQ